MKTWILPKLICKANTLQINIVQVFIVWLINQSLVR
jgi:hypothetical protein